MKELSRGDWWLVALFAFVATGAILVILYWLYRAGW